MVDLQLDVEITDLDFSVRTTNCLVRNRIITLRDLLEYDIDKLHDIRNLGSKSIKEIKKFISQLENKGLTSVSNSYSSKRVFKLLGIPVLKEERLHEVGISTIFDLVKTRFKEDVKEILGLDFDIQIGIIKDLVSKFPFSDEYEIKEMNFSVRAQNCLIREGIQYVNQLVDITESELMKIKNLGSKTKKEIIIVSTIVNELISNIDSFTIEFDIEIDSLENIHEWNHLTFINTIELSKSGFLFTNVKDLCNLYIEISENPTKYSFDVQRDIVRVISIFDEINRNLLKNETEYLENVLKKYKITPKDIKILSMRIDNTLEEIGDLFGVTRERIRQIESQKSKIIGKMFWNSFLPNIVSQNSYELYKNDKVKRAIFFSAYNSISVKMKIDGKTMMYSKDLYEYYNLFSIKIASAIKLGFQPEVNTIFSSYINDKNAFLSTNDKLPVITGYDFSINDKNTIDSFLIGCENLEKDAFIHFIHRNLIQYLSSEVFCNGNIYSDFITYTSNEILEMLDSFYNIFHSPWMTKFSDRFIEFYSANIRKYRFKIYKRKRTFLISKFCDNDPSSCILSLSPIIDMNIYDGFIRSIYALSNNVNFVLLLEVLSLNKIYIFDNVITTRCNIATICTNYMKRYESIIDTTEERMIDRLSNYFMEHNRYIYKSRNIINALPLERKIISLDYNRFMLKDFKPDVINDYINEVKYNVVFDLNEYFDSNQKIFIEYGIYNLDVLIKIFEYNCKDNIVKFGNSSYRFESKLFCTHEEQKQINQELIDIASNYKNPSYTSIFNKLGSNLVTRRVLEANEISEISQFKDFVEIIDLGNLNIYDKSKSSRIADNKLENLYHHLYDYENGFSFDEYLNLLNQLTQNAMNTKYYHLRGYYQIAKDVFIHSDHIDVKLKVEVKKHLKRIKSKYVSLKDISKVIPSWVNPYFAISMLSKEDEEYSPVEQHGKLRLNNPILVQRDSGIYSLYNLIHYILENEYRGSFSKGAVIDYLQDKSIIIQRDLPKYFFELGFAEIKEGIIILKKSNEIEEIENSDVFNLLESYFE